MTTEMDTRAWWKPDETGPEILDVTLGDMLDCQAATFGDRPAVTIDEDAGAGGAAWSYAELRAEVDEVARGLMALGIARGDHVAVMAQNCAAWVLLEYALAKVGAVLVTVNPALLRDELAYVLGQSRARALIFSPSFRSNDIAASLAQLMPDLDGLTGGRRKGGAELPGLELLIGLGEAPGFAMGFEAMREGAGAVTPEALAARQAEVQSRDVCQIQYTSGTTGKPKGAMLTHRSTVNNARLTADRGDFGPTDVLLSAMPLFHTAGCVCNVMTMLVVGGHLVTMDSFEATRMLQLWDSHAPTVLNAVPTMMTRMLEHPDFTSYRTRTLRKAFTGGTNIAPSLMRQMKERTGGDPLILMGMTECSPVITLTSPADSFEEQLATAGTPLPRTEIRIVNPETGDLCAWGESGELCIRGYNTMAGYFDMPEKTAETIDAGGWLHSGDLAELAQTGHLKIVGRLKDMIIRGGENVYPVEIEECLLDHETVSQAQVVGVPDPDLGEEICAFVMPAPGAELDPQGLQAFCRTRMARHKMPKYIQAMDALPLTANGKVQKFALREEAAKLVASGALVPVRR
ncbi:fatty-acyl-CoA synthase [Pseudooceanicola antarcticus]|uniref:3-methylmercaptopropionyl-CoA ligase n=1 Tax=Pseudooceanicola antarcticus TaxID=1247613 RepID=A0A285IYJ5_9RHOB|nr:AMP-binding protein [Pseudooceanicola antarcticus]PJE25992.1 long-chain fatty acid--CoA ligase [Pseudooceanicola antarcticus]SNY52166.1 fatty-acyl-CoA synthase [Pseudooceanicola antarcticus]